MSETFRMSSSRKKPRDPHARERLREAQAAESRAVASVYAAEAKVEAAIIKRDNARATADGWVADATDLRDQARADLVSVSGADRAALLLGLGKLELRRSVAACSQDGAA